MASPINNTLSTLATDPVRNFKFLVTFSPTDTGTKDWPTGFGTLGFVSLSGLSVSTEPIAYREGGYNTNVHQIPGQSSFTPISLSKGVMLGQSQHADWMKRLFSVLTPSATGGVGASFRCDVEIAVLSHPNPKGFAGSDAATTVSSPGAQHVSMRFKVYNAWIASLSYSNLDAGSNTLMVEELTLVHEGWDVKFGNDLTVAGSAAAFPATN
jgi:phage tail-like protein